jgi:hypothetical protein
MDSRSVALSVIQHSKHTLALKLDFHCPSDVSEGKNGFSWWTKGC